MLVFVKMVEVVYEVLGMLLKFVKILNELMFVKCGCGMDSEGKWLMKV